MRIPHTKFQNSVWTGSLGGVCALGIMFWSLPVGATDQSVPWECTGFAGESQNRCIRTFAELQQEKLRSWKRIWNSKSRRFNNYNNRFPNKHRQRLNSKANLHKIVLAGMALPQ